MRVGFVSPGDDDVASEGKASRRDRKTQQGVQRAATERLSTPDQLDQVIQVVRLPHWLYLSALLLVLAVGTTLSLVAEVPVTVRGQGILINVGGILTVTSQTEGRLARLVDVELGQKVRQGDLVAIVEQPDLLQDLEDLEDELVETRERRDRIREFQNRTTVARGATLDNRRRALRQQIDFARQHRQLLTEQVESEKELFTIGILSEFQVKETQTRLNTAEEEVVVLENELQALAEVTENQRLTHDRELLDLEQEILDTERRLASLRRGYDRETRVLSPYDGEVVEIQVNPGEIVERNGPLFSLLPSDAVAPADEGAEDSAGDEAVAPPAAEEAETLVAVLYVPPADGKKIETGMEVQLELSSHKRERYGFMLGRVEEVAVVPSTEEGMLRVLKNRQLVQQLSGTQAPFEVRVRLERNPANPSGYDWSSSRGPDTTINVGTLCIGDVITEEKLPLELLLPALSRWLDRAPSRPSPGAP